jgi:hypothetical protein
MIWLGSMTDVIDTPDMAGLHDTPDMAGLHVFSWHSDRVAGAVASAGGRRESLPS